MRDILEGFVAEGLAYEEGGRYLSLAIPEDDLRFGAGTLFRSSAVATPA